MSNPLLDQFAQKHCATVLLVRALMTVKMPLGIQVLERSFNRNAAPFSKAELCGPRVETNLTHFEANQELQLSARWKWVHASLSSHAPCEAMPASYPEPTLARRLTTNPPPLAPAHSGG